MEKSNINYVKSRIKLTTNCKLWKAQNYASDFFLFQNGRYKTNLLRAKINAANITCLMIFCYQICLEKIEYPKCSTSMFLNFEMINKVERF
jgi:hypothetical protein